ncbi:succinate dehydrogenase, cytochrome b556 subunit [Novosphingobium sediminis]|uniref:Succinate dehydrogenase cytochrome b556 subunit n=1 Tax=Novosphingobium sediminis TaxID=707214 RepID=A0A512AEX8_9SPHN|nr:succinate dehydrogenase, cytochrome b556 subunit [Novosphingobium sediminis]GEN98247.1 succinate dehydrogenase, cytochrome b556 subunit [Novosphingobium sediminis]
MAQAPGKRPLSPHLEIWRWGPAMLVSILHRITGNGLAFVGLAMLLWWISAIAGGPESYQTFLDWVWLAPNGGLQVATALLGKVVLVGLTWAFFQHMATGIRHFVLDVGAGYELEANARWSSLTILFSVAATSVFWAFVLLR